MSAYRDNYERYVRNLLGKKQIKDIKKSTVKSVYNRMLDDGKKLGTISFMHSTLRQIFQMAVDDEYIRTNPTNSIMKDIKNAYNGDDKKRTALTYPQQKALQEYLLNNKCKFHRWYPIITTLLWTGMRFGECAALTWDDVNFERREIHVRRTMIYNREHKRYDLQTKETYSLHPPKTKSGIRVIPMLPIVHNALLMEKQIQKDAGIKASSIVDGIGNFIFLNRVGHVYNGTTVNNAIKSIIASYNKSARKQNENGLDQKVLLPHFSCHILRHTMTTRMCEAGVNVKVMQEILGHSDYKLTMNVYTDVTSDYKMMQATELASYFKDMTEGQG